MFKQEIGGAVLNQITAKVGLTDTKQTSSAAENVFSTLLGVVQKNASTEKGAQDLNKALDNDHDGSVMDNIMGLFGQGDSNEQPAKNQATNGSGILKHMLGGNQQNVVQQLSKMNNMNPAATQSMMLSIAPMVMGMLGKAKKDPSVNTENIGSFLGQQEQPKNDQVSGILGMLDQDGDGSVMDDLGGMLSNLFGK